MLSTHDRLRKQLAERNKPSTASTSQSCFRSTDREKFPGWASRYAKGDLYDLNYDLCYENIKGKGDLLHRQRVNSAGHNNSDRTKRLENLQRWIQVGTSDSSRLEAVRAAASGQAIDPSKYKEVLADKIEPISSARTTIKPKQLEGYEAIERHTIDFNVRSRSGHHLRFQKQPSRKENVFKVIYDTGVQLKADPLRPNFKTQKTVHPFPSYQQHSVFNPLPTTDLTYNWTEPESKLRLRSATSLNFKLMTKKNVIKVDPHEPQPNTRLNYKHESASKLTKQRIPSWKISDALERRLVFSRQIISPKRGCSR